MAQGPADSRCGTRGTLPQRKRLNISSSGLDEWIGKVSRSARGGRLKNLVLSCHGTAGRLELGQGFSAENAYLFNQLNGLVQKIWLPDCLVAKGHTGQVFCAAMAIGIGGYVVAPT